MRVRLDGMAETGTDWRTEFSSRDGTVLQGTMRAVPNPVAGAILVHGLTGDRDENGLYEDMAGRLAAIGVHSLRFDMRGHGKTGGRYEDVTMSGTIADIGAAYCHVAHGLPHDAPAFVVGTSFGGGMSVCWAAATAAPGRPARIQGSADPLARCARLAGLVLLCPLFDFRRRFLTEKPYWGAAGPSEEAQDHMARRGWLEHDGGFRIGPAMYNELSVVRPQDRAADVDVPLLAIHGNEDSIAPHDVSRYCTATARDSEFVSIAGADHGFAHPDDDDGTHADTQRFRDEVLARAVSWIKPLARP